MAELKKIEIVSAMKVFAATSAIAGLIPGLLFGLMGGFITSMSGSSGSLPMLATMGIAAIILVPILAAIGGAIYGLIIAVIYNFIASTWGGLEITLK